jgi:hypothetical protein
VFLLQHFDVTGSGDTKTIDLKCNSELKKLQFFGAGPKTALPDVKVVFAGKICSNLVLLWNVDVFIMWISTELLHIFA